MSDGKRRGAAILAFILLALTLSASAAVIYIRPPYALQVTQFIRHIALWEAGPSDTDIVMIPRILYMDGKETVSEIGIMSHDRDMLHIAAEAALAPLTDKEISEGLETMIPEDMKLIGISGNDGYIFMDLSGNPGEEARAQIAATLSLSGDLREIHFLENGTPV